MLALTIGVVFRQSPKIGSIPRSSLLLFENLAIYLLSICEVIIIFKFLASLLAFKTLRLCESWGFPCEVKADLVLI